jgi:hypothetical protein
MSGVHRRAFMEATVAGALGGSLVTGELLADQVNASGGNLHLAPFRFDVSPPLGHSLCGGWIKPVVAYDDALEAIGYVLLGAGKPIVVCAVDWTGLLNEAHIQWRTALAEAAGTTPDRVAVHCVHQHNAPFVCLESQRIVQAQGDLPHIVMLDFFNQCLDAGRKAITEALKKPHPVSHVAFGQAKVEKVAGNRRILGPDGTVRSQRGSSSTNPEHWELPEGLIDPFLKTVAFYDGERKIAAAHYYACHPMSYYGDGRVSADFCGLARKRRQEEEPGCTHLYFDGCGGNIGAGKYNNGSKAMRAILTQRIYDGIVAAEETLRPEPIEKIHWVTQDIQPPVDLERWDEAAIMKAIEDKSLPVVSRNRPAYTVAFIRRCKAGIPITLGALHVNQGSVLHLPSEVFVEYQLRAQEAAPNRFVACPAYGDGGPWYIPTAESFPQGGYAVSVAWCKPEMERLLTEGIQSLLKQA